MLRGKQAKRSGAGVGSGSVGIESSETEHTLAIGINIVSTIPTDAIYLQPLIGRPGFPARLFSSPYNLLRCANRGVRQTP